MKQFSEQTFEKKDVLLRTANPAASKKLNANLVAIIIVLYVTLVLLTALGPVSI